MIPCRDAAAYLGEALESVRAQTRPVHELIVVDDQSTDESVAIAKRFGATVLHTTPPGCTAMARNIGWRHASGELIAFLDADDRWRPRHLEVVAALLESHPTASLAFGSIEFIGMLSGRYTGHVPTTGSPVDARIAGAIICPAPQMTSIVPRHQLEAIGGFDERLKAVEDFDLFARLAHRGPFVAAHEVTGDYRQHAAQTTRFRRRQVFLENAMVRKRNVEALRGQVAPAQFEEMEQRLREIWVIELRESWWSATRSDFDRVLEAHDRVPDSARIARAWRLRRLLCWYPWALIAKGGRVVKRSKLWSGPMDAVWQRVRAILLEKPR